MSKLPSLVAAFVLAISVASAPAAAADAKKQAEVKKATEATLEKFYKAKPAIRDEVKAAPGYAVFTSYGMSFLIGGAGGNGIAHDAASGKDTYMGMAMASAGPQIGATQKEMLMVFKTKKALQDFETKGWEFGGGGGASAGIGGKSVGGGSGEQFVNDAQVYTLTKNGVELGGLVAGTKFWKAGDLN